MNNQKVTREFVMEEVGFWVNGDNMNDKKMNDLDGDQRDLVTSNWNQEENKTQVLIKSCIFYNFFDQVRVGVDSSLYMEKCHLSEPRNNAVHAVNPKALRISNCSISKPNLSGVLVEWLEHSSQNEKCRVVQINGNEIYGVCLEAGAAIQVSSKPEFSAHNLKIKIEQNKIYKCKGEGIRIQDLAINNLQILRNEVFIMGSHCMTIKQVHQKSNKSKFLM